MVVKRAWPCSSRLTPVGEPIGFSGVFPVVGPRVFSAHPFSAAEGRRPSKTSAIGFSTTCGFEDFFCAMLTPPQSFDDMGTAGHRQGDIGQLERPIGRSTLRYQLLVVMREFPCFGVFPGHVNGMVQMQQEAFAA